MLWIYYGKIPALQALTYTWFHIGWENWKPPWTIKKGN